MFAYRVLPNGVVLMPEIPLTTAEGAGLVQRSED